jgi:hypothetical protein
MYPITKKQAVATLVPQSSVGAVSADQKDIRVKVDVAGSRLVLLDSAGMEDLMAFVRY